MAIDNAMKAEEYYKLIGEKNVEGMKKYFDSEIEFISPLATLNSTLTLTNHENL